VSGSVPPWLQSPSGLLAAAALLVALLLAVPAYVSLTAEDEPSPPAAAEIVEPISDPASDPLGPAPEDWLASDPTSENARGSGPIDAEGALDCLVQPSQIVEIGSQILGLIETVHVERGDRVEAGDVVVELEAGVERSGVEVARMRAQMKGAVRAREEALSLSSSRRERGSQLAERNALSADVREELDTQARIAELELIQAQESRRLASLELQQAMALLERRTLRAPISGVVTERLLEAGEVVDEETILKIARIDPLRVDVLMPAARYGTVKRGMRAAIEPEFPVDASVIATVSVVDPIIDAASGTFSVRLELPNPDSQIPGGLHCTVKFLDP